jgi:hypothetical protein
MIRGKKRLRRSTFICGPATDEGFRVKRKRGMASAGSVRRGKLHFRQSFGVTGHEEHLNFRPEFNDLGVDVRPAQPWHNHIDHQEIDSSRMLLGQSGRKKCT